MKNRALQRFAVAFPGIIAVLLIMALQIFDFAPLRQIGLMVFDAYQRAAPRPYQESPVRIVDIDDESINKLGQWPWPRTDIARLTKALSEAGASAIAFDVVFSEPDRTSPALIAQHLKQDGVDPTSLAALAKLPDNDERFGEAIAHAPVVMGYFLTQGTPQALVQPKAGIAVAGSAPNAVITHYNTAILPLPKLLAPSQGNGFVSLAGDSDGIIRKAPLLAMQNEQILPSLSLEALRTAQGAGSIVIKTSDGSGEGGATGNVASLKVGSFQVPVTGAGELWMYYTKPHAERTIPAWRILSGGLSSAELKAQFEGRIVFVGAGAIGLRDLISTPLQDRDLGVMVHAQAVEQIINSQFLYQPDWGAGLERAALFVLGIGLALALPWLGALRGALVGLLMLAGLFGGSYYAFHTNHFLLDPLYPAIGIVSAYLLVTGLTFYREERQRSYIHAAFDRYLSPELVRRIAQDPGQLTLGGEEREMTVLFCDIRGFSRISERFSPQEIIRFLIAFLTPMCDILLGRQATIDKFIGDAILAFWNAPLTDDKQYENAARAALDMGERLKQLNVDMRKQNTEPWPDDVQIGIGLNAGPCCVGNMGSAQRLSYTLIGDTVNLASRFEGLTKYYGVGILIGSALHAQITHFACVMLDQVRVVGRDAPERVYTLIGDEVLGAEARFAAFSKHHTAMLTAYLAQEWNAAEKVIVAQHKEAEDFGLGKLYQLYSERVSGFKLNPPSGDWDGVFDALSK